MKTINVKVQIQLDQFDNADSEIYAMNELTRINEILASHRLESQPQIFANNIDSSDIEVVNVND